MEGLNVEESILLTIRKLIGGDEEYSSSDPFVFNIIIAINSALATLNQFKVGTEGFSIEDDTAKWSDFIGETESTYGVKLDEVKSFVFLRVRKEFDPPTSSVLMQAINDQINELSWRICTKMELANQT